MSERDKLPQPVSTPEFFLRDIALSLREICDLLKGVVALQMGHSVRQQSMSEGESAGFPADFPGREALEAAGIMSLDDVPRTASRLKGVHGIGPATATEILKRL